MASLPAVPLPALYRDPRVGDLLIRTSDNVEFHVYRAIIAGASTVFADMVAIGQPTLNASDASTKPDINVVEDSVVWERLLRLCYAPGPPAADDFASLNALRAVLDAAVKYQMDVALECAGRALLFPQFIEKMPFDVYALACAYKFPDAARAAARHSLRLPIHFLYSPDLASLELPLRAHNNLSAYRRECSAVAQTLVSTRGNSSSSIAPSKAYDYSVRLTASSAVFLDNEDCTSGTCCMHYDSLLDRPLYVKTSNVIRVAAMEYLKTLHTQLEFLPDAGLALSKPLLKAMTDSARDCRVCVRVIHKQVADFSEALHAGLQKVISQVELVVDM